MLSLQFALTPDRLFCLEQDDIKSMSIMDLSSVILSTYLFYLFLLNFRLYDSLRLIFRNKSKPIFWLCGIFLKTSEGCHPSANFISPTVLLFYYLQLKSAKYYLFPGEKFWENFTWQDCSISPFHSFLNVLGQFLLGVVWWMWELVFNWWPCWW